MKPTPQEYAQALYDQLLSAPGKQQKRLISWFVDTVKQHQQLSQSDQIIDEFSDIVSRQENRKVIHLISAQPLHNLFAVGQKISAKLKEDFDLRNYINPALLGGLIIRYRDYKIDLSLSAHLGKAGQSDHKTEKLPADLLEIIDQFTTHQDLFFAPELELSHRHIEIIEFTAAQRPPISNLEKSFSAQLHQKIIIHYHQDPDMIGGAILRYDYRQVTATPDQLLASVKEE